MVTSVCDGMLVGDPAYWHLDTDSLNNTGGGRSSGISDKMWICADLNIAGHHAIADKIVKHWL